MDIFHALLDRGPALVLVTLLLALTTGCPKNIPPPENALETPDELRAAVDARTDQIESARFLDVVIDYYGEGERVKVRQLILVKQPNYLRVQTRVPGSDEILSILVSDGQTFAMHRRDTNKYFQGEATPENIARLLPVDLSARDVSRVMLGGAPWDRFESLGTEPQMQWDRREGKYRYWAETPDGGTLTMWVRHTDFTVEDVRQTDADEKVKYRYETDDWERTGNVAFPGWRRFVWPARDLDFSMDVGETQVNVELPKLLFELPPPPGSEIITVDR
jgi:outer membrane lipoprotein-sorting protein